MILKPSGNQPSQTYKSNITQTWHPMFPFQFLKDSYLELIKSAQNAIFNGCIHRKWLQKKSFGKDKPVKRRTLRLLLLQAQI